LVSFGSTSSVIITSDSLAFLSMYLFWAKIIADVGFGMPDFELSRLL
jgi:hypothetical protein